MESLGLGQPTGLQGYRENRWVVPHFNPTDVMARNDDPPATFDTAIEHTYGSPDPSNSTENNILSVSQSVTG